MKHLLLAAALAILPAAASATDPAVKAAQQECQDYGYSEGTTAYADCVRDVTKQFRLYDVGSAPIGSMCTATSVAEGGCRSYKEVFLDLRRANGGRP